jgi:dTDP-glucose pyrophosphorylase
MNIVMPIAGRGSRFREKGFTEPKPLIKILGKPMIWWATSCITYKPEELIFIVLKEHVEKFSIDQKLKELYGDRIRLVVTDGVTQGAACTVLLAKHLINNDEPLIIYNTDQFFRCPLDKAIREAGPGVKGLIPVFKATDPKWSFAKADENGFISEVAEKVPISSWATVGLYYFAHGKDFVWGAEEMIRKDIRRNNEFYVCPVYSELLAKGCSLKIVPSDFMWGLGTPEDMDHFIKHYRGDIPSIPSKC